MAILRQCYTINLMELKKPTKISERIFCFRVEVRIRDFPNTERDSTHNIHSTTTFDVFLLIAFLWPSHS
jgi:hypothetical protein